MNTEKTSMLSHILQLADHETRAGRYVKALELLEPELPPVDTATTHPDYWLGMVSLQRARAKLHLRDSDGALSALALISEKLRSVNPRIDSEYHSIMGIVYRRKAHQLFKRGDIENANEIAEQSIKSFACGQNSAEQALDGNLQFISVLNEVYTRGLLLLISGAEPDAFRPLFIDAVKAEFHSRTYTPPIAHDDLSGLTIVIDLALGAKIKPDHAISISTDDKDYIRSCSTIFGHNHKSWPEVIINAVRQSKNVKPEVVAGILRLGGKIITSDISEFTTSTLPHEFAVNIRYCILSLRDQPNADELAASLADRLNLFPPDIVKMVCNPRLFR